MRTEPPVSDPIAKSTIRAATAAAEPQEEPPAEDSAGNPFPFDPNASTFSQ